MSKFARRTYPVIDSKGSVAAVMQIINKAEGGTVIYMKYEH